MRNKDLFLLPLFLLLPTATQCMEPIKEITVVKPKTMQEIRDDRDAIYKERLNLEKSQQLYDKIMPRYIVDHILFQDDLSKTEHLLLHRSYKGPIILNKYSYLGIAIIAIQRPQFFTIEDRYYRGYHNDCLIKNPKQIPFKEKKEYIQKLYDLGFGPTDADKDFDKLGAYEQAALSRLLLQHSPVVSEIQLPQEIIDSIAIIMSEIRLLS
jgi:hypothetical protein